MYSYALLPSKSVKIKTAFISKKLNLVFCEMITYKSHWALLLSQILCVKPFLLLSTNVKSKFNGYCQIIESTVTFYKDSKGDLNSKFISIA